MPTAYTSLLGLALPVSGDLTGTWGDTVNNAITSLLDAAVAGTTTLSTDADVTLTDTTGAANQARAAVLRWTANGSITRSITAPARSKAYIVINDTAGTQSIVLRGAGPTTGVTIAAAERALVVWNGTDFTKVSSGGGSGAGSTTLISETFSGTGAQLIYTLANNPGLQANTQVYVGGVYQNKSTYTVVGTTLTFSEAPPSGTNNIEVMIVLATPVGFTDSASVTFLQSGTGAVTRTAQAKMRDVVSVKDFGAFATPTERTAALTLALAAHDVVLVNAGTYDPFEITADNKTLFMDGGVEFKIPNSTVASSDVTGPAVFGVSGSNVTINGDFTVNGNKANNSSNSIPTSVRIGSCYVTGNNVRFNGTVTISNAYWVGFSAEDPAGSTTEITDLYIKRLKITDADYHSVMLWSVNRWRIDDIYATGGTVGSWIYGTKDQRIRLGDAVGEYIEMQERLCRVGLQR